MLCVPKEGFCPLSYSPEIATALHHRGAARVGIIIVCMANAADCCRSRFPICSVGGAATIQYRHPAPFQAEGAGLVVWLQKGPPSSPRLSISSKG
jgi:hypothetical protein